MKKYYRYHSRFLKLLLIIFLSVPLFSSCKTTTAGSRWVEENRKNSLIVTDISNEAVKAAEDALESDVNEYGPDDIRTAVSLIRLADIYAAKLQYSYAQPLYRRAVSILENGEEINKRLLDSRMDSFIKLNRDCAVNAYNFVTDDYNLWQSFYDWNISRSHAVRATENSVRQSIRRDYGYNPDPTLFRSLAGIYTENQGPFSSRDSSDHLPDSISSRYPSVYNPYSSSRRLPTRYSLNSKVTGYTSP